LVEVEFLCVRVEGGGFLNGGELGGPACGTDDTGFLGDEFFEAEVHLLELLLFPGFVAGEVVVLWGAGFKLLDGLDVYGILL
jgi:hypothetical protein